MVLTRKIRVLQIGGNTQKNGITTFLLSLYRRICEDFTFFFINTAFRTSDAEIAREILRLGGRIYHLPCNSVSEIEDKLKNVILEERPDVLHSHYFFSNGDHMRIAFECDVPVRITHCHNDKRGFISDKEKELLLYSRELTEKYATVKLALSEEAGRFMYGDNLFNISHASIETEMFFPISDKQDLLKRHNLSPDYKYSLFVGRFAPQKNIDFFVDLFRNFHDRKLIMVGDGECKPTFLEKINTAGIADKFIFLSDEKLNELYNIADSFLLPSLYEGVGLVLIEAQYAGTPCFASDKISKEADLGMIEFLPLNSDVWVELLKKHKKSENLTRVDISKFNADIIAERLREYYTAGNYLGDAYIHLAKEYMLGRVDRYGDRKKVVENMKQAHELGNPRGSFYYALQFFEGTGVEKDIVFAESLVKEVIETIENEVQRSKQEYLTILADMYSFGLGKQQSFDQAFSYYLKAAELGNTEAMCDLGYMYSVGQGVEENQEKSFEWYKRSANTGYLHSMRDVGVCYYKGLGVSQNFKEAVKWFKKASGQNYAHATCDLALCYLKGNGVRKNLIQAAKYYLLAIKQEEGRSIRDVIAHCIDVSELRDNHRIRFISRDHLDIVDENILSGNTICMNEHIKSVDTAIFYGYNIAKFFVEKENENYKAYGGVLYSKDGNMLVRFPLGSPITEFVVPEHVKYIGAYALQNCRNLASVKLHNGILSIGDSAFDDCKNMLEMVLPSSLERIGNWAFHGCDKLEKIFIPKNVKEIGFYTFGSCNNLREITVDENNIIVLSFNGDMYTKDFSVILQYAIGKRERIFALPPLVKKISFRAFSDAFNLEYVNACFATEIEEKAFYYCNSLKNILLSPDCIIANENVFDHTTTDFKITYSKNGRILLAADIHGHLRLEFLTKKVAEFIPTVNDIIVILGDIGIVWQTPMRDDIRKFYSELPCDVLFLDGNHENFDLLNKFPIVQRYGGVVHEVLSNVFHLMRGNAYIINGKKVFIFGGAYSVKRESSSSPVKTWNEELPNASEYAVGLKTVSEHENRFDYILTHQAPKGVLNNIGYYYSAAEVELVSYLGKISEVVDYHRWYFGHLHKDFIQDKFVSLYENTAVIE